MSLDLLPVYHCHDIVTLIAEGKELACRCESLCPSDKKRIVDHVLVCPLCYRRLRRSGLVELISFVEYRLA